MNVFMWTIDFFTIILCVILLVTAIKNYGKYKIMHKLHVAVASAMALCAHYVRGMDFFLRKNGGDDRFEEGQPIVYVNHMDNLKVLIEEQYDEING